MSNSASENAGDLVPRETRASVLSGMRLSKDDDRRSESRARFSDMYRPRLFVFFKRAGVSDHDAEDLAQDLLAKLLKRMDTFDYNPAQRFRAYLRDAARNALKDFWSECARRRTAGGIDLEQYVSREDLQRRLEEQFDLDLLEEAKERVRHEVSHRDWKIFVELTEQPTTPEELAATLGIARHSVDVAKSRVISRIKTAVRKLHGQNQEEL